MVPLLLRLQPCHRSPRSHWRLACRDGSFRSNRHRQLRTAAKPLRRLSRSSCTLDKSSLDASPFHAEPLLALAYDYQDFDDSHDHDSTGAQNSAKTSTTGQVFTSATTASSTNTTSNSTSLPHRGTASGGGGGGTFGGRCVIFVLRLKTCEFCSHFLFRLFH
jgi:hypothetical protein